MLYKFIVGIVFLVFISSFFSLLLGIWQIFHAPIAFALWLFLIIPGLLTSPALFSIIRYFKFKKLGLSFLPESFLEIKPKGYKVALVFAWLGHFGLAYVIFLRFFTYQYAGAGQIPIILYVICICIMESSIKTWYKTIDLEQAE